jgi:kynureninase
LDVSKIVGSSSIKLHDWKVDGAIFKTNKYLNSSSLCGLFIHENHKLINPALLGKYLEFFERSP